MSEYILNSINSGESKYSSLLIDNKVLEKLGGVDNLISEIDSLVAKGYLTIERVYDIEEGDDFIFKISKIGKAFLNMKERKKG